MRDADYDGPGVYEVTVSFRGSATYEVEALSSADAERKAMHKACDFDADVEPHDVTSVDLLERTDLTGATEHDRERLTGIEEAYFALTGKVPKEAIARLAAIDALEEAVA